ncbi:integral membrane protein [Aspergillus ellipticus CBS 707.79]|uniref:Integral membrane protein n=1 Tax=Aspergillus ellipticus CBS 707.79 TaxID=1448320 RepID=A0A319ESC0_9EURO|nr:integral membrane protein [Aspergillus ellipticus CBS 707.79]
MAAPSPSPSPITFTITHMNANHQDSLSAYLQVYCHVSARDAQSARLESLTLSDLLISAAGTRYTVPISPPMANFSESRTRLVAMHKECLARLGRSDITITSYRPPEGKEIFFFFVCVSAFVGFWQRSNFLPGAWVYETVGLRAVPGFADLCYRAQPVVFAILAGSHTLEASLLTVKRLRRHGVPVLSGVWCAWVLSNLIEGFTVWLRFDRLVREERARGKGEEHRE